MAAYHARGTRAAASRLVTKGVFALFDAAEMVRQLEATLAAAYAQVAGLVDEVAIGDDLAPGSAIEQVAGAQSLAMTIDQDLATQVDEAAIMPGIRDTETFIGDDDGLIGRYPGRWRRQGGLGERPRTEATLRRSAGETGQGEDE